MSAWHCLAWLIRFCGGINSGSINCGSQHGIAWLGGFESVAASILVASIVVVVRHGIAWLRGFDCCCGGINSGSINCGSQHGIAWLG